jgi:predicted DCC family thiol-disulfide oxidoreductase YuxK
MTAPAATSMFFDAGCGPCTFWARFTAGLARPRLSVHALDSPEADRQLHSLTSDVRYGAFHIVEGERTWTGADAMPVWVGLLAGRRARTVAERSVPVNRVLRIFYLRFWEYRRAHGCAS